MKKILKINEQYLDSVPRPTVEEYKSMRDSIDMEGQKDPIVINDKGIILDGHTRYDILTSLGREIDYRIKQFDNIEDEKYYVIECNLNRRSFNAFQKLELSQKLQDQIRKQMKDRQRLGENYDGGDGKHLNWRKELSKRVGIGENTCQQGYAVLKSNNIELITNCREGKLSILEAYRVIRPDPTYVVRKPGYKKGKVQCPHCETIMGRSEWKIIND